MTDIPTAPDNKPSNLRDILANFSWHLNYDRLPPSMQTNVDQAVAAIEQYGREQRIDENDIWLAHSTSRRLNDNEPAIRTVDFQERKAELQAIDTTLRNFSGQTDTKEGE